MLYKSQHLALMELKWLMLFFRKQSLYFMICHQGKGAIDAKMVKNKIINGITDWVYEERKFARKTYDWNVTGT